MGKRERKKLGKEKIEKQRMKEKSGSIYIEIGNERKGN